MSNPTAKYLLMEERLGRPLERHVMRLRGTSPRAATSWEQIAHQLAVETGVVVTSESLRSWFTEAERRRLDRAESKAA